MRMRMVMLQRVMKSTENADCSSCTGSREDGRHVPCGAESGRHQAPCTHIEQENG